jgi:hypothetical protein
LWFGLWEIQFCGFEAAELDSAVFKAELKYTELLLVKEESFLKNS